MADDILAQYKRQPSGGTGSDPLGKYLRKPEPISLEINKQHPLLSDTDRRMITNLEDDPEAIRVWLEDRGFKTKMGEGGKVLMKKGSDPNWYGVEHEGTWYNPFSWERKDIGDIGNELGSLWAMGKGAIWGGGAGTAVGGPVGTVVGGMAGAGAGAASAEAVRRAAARAAGFRKGESGWKDIADIGQEGLLGAAGEGVGRAVVGGAKMALPLVKKALEPVVKKGTKAVSLATQGKEVIPGKVAVKPFSMVTGSVEPAEVLKPRSTLSSLGRTLQIPSKLPQHFLEKKMGGETLAEAKKSALSTIKKAIDKPSELGNWNEFFKDNGLYEPIEKDLRGLVEDFLPSAGEVYGGTRKLNRGFIEKSKDIAEKTLVAARSLRDHILQTKPKDKYLLSRAKNVIDLLEGKGVKDTPTRISRILEGKKALVSLQNEVANKLTPGVKREFISPAAGIDKMLGPSKAIRSVSAKFASSGPGKIGKIETIERLLSGLGQVAAYGGGTAGAIFNPLFLLAAAPKVATKVGKGLDWLSKKETFTKWAADPALKGIANYLMQQSPEKLKMMLRLLEKYNPETYEKLSSGKEK